MFMGGEKMLPFFIIVLILSLSVAGQIYFGNPSRSHPVGKHFQRKA